MDIDVDAIEAPQYLKNITERIARSTVKTSEVKLAKQDLLDLLNYHRNLEKAYEESLARDINRQYLIPQIAQALADLRDKKCLGFLDALGSKDLVPLANLITDFVSVKGSN